MSGNFVISIGHNCILPRGVDDAGAKTAQISRRHWKFSIRACRRQVVSHNRFEDKAQDIVGKP